MKNKLCFLLLFFCFVSFPIFSQNMYLELNLNDSRRANPFAVPASPLEIFRVIERAALDDRVKGIILNIGSLSRSRDYLWELRNSLEQFKAKDKKIAAFISSADMDAYALASIADKIVMDETGYLRILGYSAGSGYVLRALEKLGIGVRELRYFEYKSASEIFSRDSMSEADRRQNNDYLDDIFNLTRSTIIKARNWTDEKFDAVLNNGFIFSAKDALNQNLIDRIGRKEAVLEIVNELEGEEVKNFAMYSIAGQYGGGTSLTGALSYTPPRAGGLFTRTETIAVVYAEGETDMESGMAAASLSRTIRNLADNKRIKAIVLRINSPGGSPEAADYIDEAVRYAKEKKPVVVSMGQLAASGGYWAAMNASHIAANPYTITASIGVIGTWFYEDGLNEKLGINLDILQRGAHADLMTWFLIPYRDLNDQEEERYKLILQDTYRIFTEKVAAGRGMDMEKVEAAAQGRILSGIRALDAGLVDSLGSLNDALRIARELAEIPENRAVRYDEYPKLSFADRFLNQIPFISVLFRKSAPQSIPFARLNQNAAADFFTNMFLPDGVRFRIENNGRIMAILPLGFFTGGL